MIASSSISLVISTLASALTAGSLPACHGFTVSRPSLSVRSSSFPRLPILRFQEDDVDLATQDVLLTSPVNGNLVFPLPGMEVISDLDLAIDPIQDAVDTATKTESLSPLNFEVDIESFLDVARPYYALKNEHAIVDDSTGETVGFVCTVRGEMPMAGEVGDLAFAEGKIVFVYCQSFIHGFDSYLINYIEVGRHVAVAGTVAALLRNPKRSR